MDLDEFLAAEAAVSRCERARARAEVLHAELAAEQETCQRLRRRLDDERRSGGSNRGGRGLVGSLVGRLRGRSADPAAPPRPEVTALTAELSAHERAMQRLSTEFRAARDEAADLDDARARLTAATEARASAIAEADDDRAARLGALDDGLAIERRTRDELRDAQRSALGAIGALGVAIDRLGTAEGWSVADIMSDRSGGFRHGVARFGGDVAGVAKHDALDHSVVPVAEAHAALLSLRAELADLSGPGDGDVHHPNIRMPSSAMSTLDVWFDNTFSDLMVHDRITSSITELERARRSIDELLAMLSPRVDAADARVADLEQSRTDLLRS